MATVVNLEEHRPALIGHCGRMPGGWVYCGPNGHHWVVLGIDPEANEQ